MHSNFWKEMSGFKVGTIFVAIITLVFSLPNLVNGEPDVCYDQVGDGHLCFQTLQKCQYEQKNDNKSESPCYRD